MYFREDFLLPDQAGRRHVTISDSHQLLSTLGLHQGKRGYGLSVQLKVSNAPIAILGLTPTAEGRLKIRR